MPSQCPSNRHGAGKRDSSLHVAPPSLLPNTTVVMGNRLAARRAKASGSAGISEP